MLYNYISTEMDKRILLESGGFPVYTRDLVALQNNLLATTVHLAKMIAGDDAPCMLRGQLVNEGNKWTVSEGALIYNNDIFPVKQGSITLQEGETAYLSIQVSADDIRVYKDGNEHPAQASYVAVLTTTKGDFLSVPCTSVLNYQTQLRDLIDSVGHVYEKIDLEPADSSSVKSEGLLIQETIRNNHRDVYVQGQVFIESFSHSEIAKFYREGLYGFINGILYPLSTGMPRTVVVRFMEQGNQLEIPYISTCLNILEADGTPIRELNITQGYVLCINGHLNLYKYERNSGY